MLLRGIWKGCSFMMRKCVLCTHFQYLLLTNLKLNSKQFFSHHYKRVLFNHFLIHRREGEGNFRVIYCVFFGWALFFSFSFVLLFFSIEIFILKRAFCFFLSFKETGAWNNTTLNSFNSFKLNNNNNKKKSVSFVYYFICSEVWNLTFT